MRLRDGTVLPHYMGVKNTAGAQSAPGFFGEVALLVGEVIEIHYPDSVDNSSGKFTEYTVNVWRRQSNVAVERLAFRCSQADTFGGVGDWFRFSFRPATSDPNEQPLANGATVLIACINGDRSNAYIIAAIPQPNRKQVDPLEKDGVYLRSRFNGVEAQVKDDGSFELMVPGATDTDGRPGPDRDTNNKGSRVAFAANGDITIDDQAGESVVISPGKKTIEVKASDKLNESAKDVKVDASGSWKLKAPKVVVVSDDVSLGGDNLLVPDNGVVFGGGIDTFTGAPYSALGNASKTVKVKK